MSGIDSTLKSEAREVRRLEMIDGALGRRRWSPEAKARIVAESLAPGVAVSEVARRHDLLPQQVFVWRRQAKQGRLALPAEALSFVPVITAAAMPSPSDCVEATPSASSVAPTEVIIEVALAGAIVRVPPAVDGKLLAKVLRAVRSVA
jgi:transposase